MEVICKITDEDIGEKVINMENPKLRLGARGIVIREDGKIAVFNKSNKNEYKLPGGGLEGEEKPEDAFKREIQHINYEKIGFNKLIKIGGVL